MFPDWKELVLQNSSLLFLEIPSSKFKEESISRMFTLGVKLSDGLWAKSEALRFILNSISLLMALRVWLLDLVKLAEDNFKRFLMMLLFIGLWCRTDIIFCIYYKSCLTGWLNILLVLAKIKFRSWSKNQILVPDQS